MHETMSPGIEELRNWIGRTETTTDIVTPRLARELSATLGGSDATPQPGAYAPYGVHWCLAPAIVTATSVKADGHPALGGFIPPVPLPRRMWAGGSLQFHHRLLVGDTLKRHSRIADVTMKNGRTGTLCFVTIKHEFFSQRGLAIRERQDIVYRDLGPPSAEAKPPRPYKGLAPEWRQEMRADPVLLFRYSAITFNGHRIHYDRDYAMTEEFYPGLVVHGPLQATMLQGFACGILGRHPENFSFRGVNPLFDFQGFALAARQDGEKLSLWVQNEDGIQTMAGEAA